MKKLNYAIIALLITITSFAQVNDNALGLRGELGDGENRGEISYQLGLGDANRLELDLGYSRQNAADEITLAGIYHWVFNIGGGFNLFIGPGARVGSYLGGNTEARGLTLALGGQVGAEYDFSDYGNGPPILISFDTRPMYRFSSGNDGLGYGGAFALRIVF